MKQDKSNNEKISYYEKILETNSSNRQANIKLYKLYLQNKRYYKTSIRIGSL